MVRDIRQTISLLLYYPQMLTYSGGLARFRCDFRGPDFERHFYLRPCTPQRVNPFCWAKMHCSETSIAYHTGIYFLFRDDDFQRENHRFREIYK